MRKRINISVCVVLLLSILFGCTSPNVIGEGEGKKVSVNKISGFPKAVVDANGEEIVIETQPSKIVSLMPSNTEIIYALGRGEFVVGVSEWDNYPEEVKTVEKIGDLDFNIEKIMSMEPDLVMAHASSMSGEKDGLDQLRNAGIPVVVVNNATTFSDVYDSISLIGSVVGAENEATELINSMKISLEKIKAKAAGIAEEEMKAVWVEVSPQPELFTAGKGTFIDEMLTIIHAKNTAKDYEGWVQFTEEDAVLLNPDVIVVTYGHYLDNPTEQVFSRAAWKDVPAVASKNVFEVHPDMVTRSGPRLIEGVEQLASVIYPEVFK